MSEADSPLQVLGRLHQAGRAPKRTLFFMSPVERGFRGIVQCPSLSHKYSGTSFKTLVRK